MNDRSAVRFWLSDEAIQDISPCNSKMRFEGVAFSASGNTLAVATSEGNTVLLHRRLPDGKFEEQPFSFLSVASGIDYPHDLSFVDCDGFELLAVVQRRNAVTIFRRDEHSPHFDPKPLFEINGRKSLLNFSDGVSFVPPNNRYLAACNLRSNTVLFYDWAPGPPTTFQREPVFELKHPTIAEPDGLAFSKCGRWLATANHHNHTVTILRRVPDPPEYCYEPTEVLSDQTLRYPHSVAFTNDNYLAVTNAGANYFSIYEPRFDGGEVSWSGSPIVRRAIAADAVFERINAVNKMEGGPKGIASHENLLAVCSPGRGVRIFEFQTHDLHASSEWV